jgi:hypothetical protein
MKHSISYQSTPLLADSRVVLALATALTLCLALSSLGQLALTSFASQTHVQEMAPQKAAAVRESQREPDSLVFRFGQQPRAAADDFLRTIPSSQHRTFSF